MKTKTEQILAVMNVLAWITFIGLMVKAGAILVSYGISTFNLFPPKNLYKGLDLSQLKEFSFFHYTVSVSFMVAILILEAYVAFLVTSALSKIKMANPFTIEVSHILERISYFILGIWIVAMLSNVHTGWLSKRVDGLQLNTIPGEFIFLAGVVFVFSQIFKKGVEIQSENELTV
jgi:hypothetical protein